MRAWSLIGLGWLWILCWAVVLFAVVSPWRRLGGLVGELLRWLEWCALAGGLIAGLTVGGFARDLVVASAKRSHLSLLRFVLYPPALLAACAMLSLRWTGKGDPIGVVLTAFLAYWAGLDTAIGAWPLTQGRSYRLRGTIDPDPPDDRDDEEPKRSPATDSGRPWAL